MSFAPQKLSIQSFAFNLWATVAYACVYVCIWPLRRVFQNLVVRLSGIFVSWCFSSCGTFRLLAVLLCWIGASYSLYMYGVRYSYTSYSKINRLKHRQIFEIEFSKCVYTIRMDGYFTGGCADGCSKTNITNAKKHNGLRTKQLNESRIRIETS